jgi:hypothetical protein
MTQPAAAATRTVQSKSNTPIPSVSKRSRSTEKDKSSSKRRKGGDSDDNNSTASDDDLSDGGSISSVDAVNMSFLSQGNISLLIYGNVFDDPSGAGSEGGRRQSTRARAEVKYVESDADEDDDEQQSESSTSSDIEDVDRGFKSKVARKSPKKTNVKVAAGRPKNTSTKAQRASKSAAVKEVVMLESSSDSSSENPSDSETSRTSARRNSSSQPTKVPVVSHQKKTRKSAGKTTRGRKNEPTSPSESESTNEYSNGNGLPNSQASKTTISPTSKPWNWRQSIMPGLSPSSASQPRNNKQESAVLAKSVIYLGSDDDQW